MREGRRGIAIVWSAVVIGVTGDVLFYGRGLGVNVFAFAVVFVLGLAVVLRLGRVSLHQGRRWMALPLLVFAGAFAVHGSPLLVVTNLIAIVGAISLGALVRAQPRPHHATLGEYAAGLASAGASTFAGSIELLERDVPWDKATRGLRVGGVGVLGRGMAIGAPFLLVFGGLFFAADSAFRQLVQSTIPATLPHAWPQVLVSVGIAWAAGGLLRDLASDRDDARLARPDALISRTPKIRLGGAEVAIALGAVDLLFLAFVLVQARFLFGGRSVVLSHEHLTYAQYARHGFFELLAVSVLVVPVVLAANATAREHQRLIRGLCATLIGLELAVAASALQRMHAYVDQFGLTELRLYATGVIIWIAVVLVWSFATVLYGEKRRFAIGVIVAGFAATLALNAVNPDALIARTNIARGHADPAYLSQLSDDAVPTLVARLPRITDPAAQAALAQALLARKTETGVLSWNRSRSAARSAVASHRDELESFARR
jgi:hypothetical protein